MNNLNSKRTEAAATQCSHCMFIFIFLSTTKGYVVLCLNSGPLFLCDKQELTSGSDSDMSLSSMIFPNNSSGSDDSVGEGDLGMGLEQSMVLLEHNEIQTEEELLHGNVWRIYFGSSYELEMGNSPISGLVSSAEVFLFFSNIAFIFW